MLGVFETLALIFDPLDPLRGRMRPLWKKSESMLFLRFGVLLMIFAFRGRLLRLSWPKFSIIRSGVK